MVGDFQLPKMRKSIWIIAGFENKELFETTTHWFENKELFETTTHCFGCEH
jgi:hypothetical protein